MDKLAKILIGFGITITLWVWLFESSTAFNWGRPGEFLEDLAFELMLSVPWLVLLFLNIKNKNRLGVIISAIPMALLELLACQTRFINPQGSTAALIYAVKPFYQIIFMTIGLLIGVGISKGKQHA